MDKTELDDAQGWLENTFRIVKADHDYNKDLQVWSVRCQLSVFAGFGSADAKDIADHNWHWLVMPVAPDTLELIVW